jgi:hypothetical protein
VPAARNTVSILERLFKRPPPGDAGADRPSGAPQSYDGERDAPVDARDVHDIVRVEETSEAEFFAGDLFRRRFRQEPPGFPHHYVAFYRDGRTRYLPLGYVHYSEFEDSYLCGGLVIDDRLYRRIPSPHRNVIRAAGGLAELLLRDTFARLAFAPAIYSYVGDRQSEVVCLRVGFRRVQHEHVMVAWQRELSDADKAARLARVFALGPF